MTHTQIDELRIGLGLLGGLLMCLAASLWAMGVVR